MKQILLKCVRSRAVRAVAIGCLAAFALHTLGAQGAIEKELFKRQFSLSDRPVSGNIVLVEIDRQSIDSVGVWPWSRRLHALALERLRSAGAASVFFDIDFSAASDPEGDALFARALDREGPPVHVAVFSQSTASAEGKADVGPPEEMLGSANPTLVNMVAEHDGKVWQVSSSDTWRGQVTPSMFAAIANRPSPARFWIDYGIDVETLPSLSYLDVVTGAFDPEAVAGKTIVVGATAIELGDLVGVPRHGVLPGVVVQILAAESIVLGRTLHLAHPALTVFLILIASLLGETVARRFSWRAVFLWTMCTWATLFGGAVVAQHGAAVLVEIVPAIVASLLTIFAGYAQRVSYLDLKLLTESLALRRAQAFMHRVAGDMQDGLLVLDSLGRVKTINTAAIEMFGTNGYMEADLPVFDFCIWPRLTSEAEMHAALLMGSRARSPERIICRRASGEDFYAEITVSAMPQESDERWILVIRDATEKVHADRLARRREQHLRDLTIRAEAATRTKTEFVAAMSHELRTPLNAIIGCATIMNTEQLGPLSDPYKAFSGEIRDGGARLLRLLSHILDYANAEIDTVMIERARHDLSDLLTEVVELQRPRAEAAGLELSFDDLPHRVAASVDPIAIQKAVGNLLANAIRFTPNGGSVAVTMSQSDDTCVELRVEDSGIGIPEDEIARCFEPFEQIDRSETRAVDGAGLGLTVAKTFIEQHGGSLTLKSAVGIGTIALIRLPLGLGIEASELEKTREAFKSAS